MFAHPNQRQASGVVLLQSPVEQRRAVFRRLYAKTSNSKAGHVIAIVKQALGKAEPAVGSHRSSTGNWLLAHPSQPSSQVTAEALQSFQRLSASMSPHFGSGSEEDGEWGGLRRASDTPKAQEILSDPAGNISFANGYADNDDRCVPQMAAAYEVSRLFGSQSCSLSPSLFAIAHIVRWLHDVFACLCVLAREMSHQV
jgi:hypothetical protein